MSENPATESATKTEQGTQGEATQASTTEAKDAGSPPADGAKSMPGADDGHQAERASETALAGDNDSSAHARSVAAARAAEPPLPAWTSRIPLAIAIAFPILLFFVLPPLSRSGMWDPYELNVAELSRRIAVNLFGAQDLVLAGGENGLPLLDDLGRPQLAFTVIAMGFKLFHLHDWAGRAPLALFGVFGVVATYAFVAKLFDRKAGVYSAVALSTMPLYFVQARMMLGEICTMASLAMAFGGLAVLVFDRDESGNVPRSEKRIPWLLLAVAGLYLGFSSRGAVLGIAVPCLGVGVAWALGFAAGSWKGGDPQGDIVGGVSLAAGIVISLFAFDTVYGSSRPTDLSLIIGALLKDPAHQPSFDMYIASIGHSIAPWSAFVPFAFGRLFMRPVGISAAAEDREAGGRTALIVGATFAFAAHAFLAPHTELIAFCAPAILAAACGVALRDFERGAASSTLIGLGTVMLLAVLHHDFHELPEKAYQAFGVAGGTFPENFKATSLMLWWVSLGAFAVMAFLSFAETDSDGRKAFDPKTYLKIFEALRDAYDGLLAQLFLVVVVTLLVAGGVILVGQWQHAAWATGMALQVREILTYAGVVVAIAPLAVVFGVQFACDLWIWAFNESRPFSLLGSVTRGFEPFENLFTGMQSANKGERLISIVVLGPLMLLAIPAVVYLGLHAGSTLNGGMTAAVAILSGGLTFVAFGILGDLLRHRAPAVAFGGAVAGVVLCVSYYPALANQLSPKEVFDTFSRNCGGNAPIGLLGVGGRTSAYYAGRQPTILTDATKAFEWLSVEGGERRCLATKTDDLPRLNSLYREKHPGAGNLPVLDGRSSQIVLVGSALAPGEKNQNSFETILPSEEPQPQHPFTGDKAVNMDDKIQVLGFDIVDSGGKKVESVAPGRTYRLRKYYKILAPVGQEWETFVHIDGQGRRHNGDQKALNGKYPMALWIPGDVIADETEFKLEPNFSSGTYTIYFGFYQGENRLKVKSGPNDGENRINGGPLRVQ